MKRKSRWIPLLLLLILAAVFPLQHAMGKNEGEITVKTKTVNVREGAGLSFPVVKQIAKGETYSIIKEDGDWIEIRLGAGQTGWVANWLVGRSTNQEQVKNTSASQGTIIGSSVRVRTGPGTSFQTVGSLSKGTAITVLSQNENWIKIKTAGLEGWAAAEYIQLSGPSDNTKKDAHQTGVTLGDRLNVRAEPSTASANIGKLSKNTTVTIYQTQGDWIQIDFEGTKGWVSRSYIDTGKEKGQTETDFSGTTARITVTGLNVRKSASLNSEVIASVNKDESYPVLQQKNQMTQLQLPGNKKGWVVNWFVEVSNQKNIQKNKTDVEGSKITTIYDGTILRSRPDLNAKILKLVQAGETFSVTGKEGDWYSIKLKDGKTAYVAGWIVTRNGSTNQVKRTGIEKYLDNKVIVLDPGHGGRDGGTIGISGTLEKDLTIRTAELLRDKLQAAGAKVILTRSTNTYVPLPSRVSISHIHNADAFISLHYDSTQDEVTSGITAYYYHSYQQSLARNIASSLTSVQMPNRGTRYGNFHVIRENKRAATLIELGYLSNPVDELTITTNEYQEAVTTSIYNGLARYFK